MSVRRRFVNRCTWAPRSLSHARTITDPRFERDAGTFDEDRFRKSYAFLGKYRDSEIDALAAEVRTATDVTRRAELNALLIKLKQQRGEDAHREATRGALSSIKRKEREKVAAGKAPYFPKRRELKEIAAEERFKALEDKGGAAAVAKAMRRRSKKLKAKAWKRGAAPVRRAPVEDGR